MCILGAEVNNDRMDVEAGKSGSRDPPLFRAAEEVELGPGEHVVVGSDDPSAVGLGDPSEVRSDDPTDLIIPSRTSL